MPVLALSILRPLLAQVLQRIDFMSSLPNSWFVVVQILDLRVLENMNDPQSYVH